MRIGAVGSSWNADRKTVKLNAQMMRKRGVNSRADESTVMMLPGSRVRGTAAGGG